MPEALALRADLLCLVLDQDVHHPLAIQGGSMTPARQLVKSACVQCRAFLTSASPPTRAVVSASSRVAVLVFASLGGNELKSEANTMCIMLNMLR